MSLSILTAVFLTACLLTVLSLFILIPAFRKKKLGQKILEIGPAWHHEKEGTPTMGGISFILAITMALMLSLLLLKGEGSFRLRPVLLVLLYALTNGMIGMVDDMTKFGKKQNEGLTPGQKLILQTLSSLLFLLLLWYYGYLDSTILLPFSGRVLELGTFYYLLALPFMLFFVNCANLTDGIDGLAGTVAATEGFFLCLIGAYKGSLFLFLIGGALAGGCLGFLFFNRHPAKIFMGDTGSLFLGALVTGSALLEGSAVALFPLGFVYLIEGLSVILQVFWFKRTGKRLFLMAPLHHHLEKEGLSEDRIVLRFAALTAIGGIIAFLIWS